MPVRIEKIFLLPPLGFARVGSGSPLDAYGWGPDDRGPRGTGKATIVPLETIDIEADGSVKPRMPKEVRFKEVIERDDAEVEVFKKVCPWFELHARWRELTGAENAKLEEGEDREGPVTLTLLGRAGIALMDLRWRVVVANRKAYNMTLSPGDIVQADTDIQLWPVQDWPPLVGTNSRVKRLVGWSTEAYDIDKNGPTAKLSVKPNTVPLVLAPDTPRKPFMDLGAVQLAVPSAELPEIRLRFFPPDGVVYGPGPAAAHKSLPKRLKDNPVQGRNDWRKLDLLEDPGRLILNPEAAWCNKSIKEGLDEYRTEPGMEFAYQEVHTENGKELRSLGLLDDFSDGYIECAVHMPERGIDLKARARVVVGPPDFAPDRRQLVTVADNFTDRVRREELLAEYATLGLEAHSDEVHELFLRAFETMGLVNVDAMNTKFDSNGSFPVDDLETRTEPLPLTEHARRMHRRLTAQEALEDVFRERMSRRLADPERRLPKSFNELVNRPPRPDGTADPDNRFDKMPMLMRGSDVTPMHLTYWQYHMLQLWRMKLLAELRERGEFS